MTAFDGPAVGFEFPGLRIGVAEYAEGPTGFTVFQPPNGGPMAVDVRGGSVGVVGDCYGWAHGVCLAGGSLYGLEAAGGVMAELAAQREYTTAFTQFPLVAGAIIDCSSTMVRGCVDRETGQRTHPDQLAGEWARHVFPVESTSSGDAAILNVGENTTLTVVVTNMRLSGRNL